MNKFYAVLLFLIAGSAQIRGMEVSEGQECQLSEVQCWLNQLSQEQLWLELRKETFELFELCDQRVKCNDKLENDLPNDLDNSNLFLLYTLFEDYYSQYKFWDVPVSFQAEASVEQKENAYKILQELGTYNRILERKKTMKGKADFSALLARKAFLHYRIEVFQRTYDQVVEMFTKHLPKVASFGESEKS